MLSTTVTVAVQEASPAEFSAVRVTVTDPAPTIVPAAGDWETITLHPVATTSLVKSGMTASQFASTVIVLFEAQVVIVGAAGAITVTVKPQVSPSIVVQVTMVLPAGKLVPDGGSQVTVLQVPLVVGAG